MIFAMIILEIYCSETHKLNTVCFDGSRGSYSKGEQDWDKAVKADMDRPYIYDGYELPNNVIITWLPVFTQPPKTSNIIEFLVLALFDIIEDLVMQDDGALEDENVKEVITGGVESYDGNSSTNASLNYFKAPIDHIFYQAFNTLDDTRFQLAHLSPTKVQDKIEDVKYEHKDSDSKDQINNNTYSENINHQLNNGIAYDSRSQSKVFVSELEYKDNIGYVRSAKASPSVTSYSENNNEYSEIDVSNYKQLNTDQVSANSENDNKDIKNDDYEDNEIGKGVYINNIEYNSAIETSPNDCNSEVYDGRNTEIIQVFTIREQGLEELIDKPKFELFQVDDLLQLWR